MIFPSDDSQRKQYEEWLQETQQLLQMQQKYLEEQIGVHRKSKKALSAKQRTAKKAGREFPEEDAEQLKHVTEQQSVVQKQLEQVTDRLLGGSPQHQRDVWCVAQSGTGSWLVLNVMCKYTVWAPLLNHSPNSPCPLLRVAIRAHRC